MLRVGRALHPLNWSWRSPSFCLSLRLFSTRAIPACGNCGGSGLRAKRPGAPVRTGPPRPHPLTGKNLGKSPTPTSSTGGAALLTSVDKPEVDKPVVRGPTIGNLEVDRDLLDPTRHTYQGESKTTRPFPLLPDSLSHLKYDLDHQLLRNPLPYGKTRLSENIERRTRVIYNPSGNGLVKEFGNEWNDYYNSTNGAAADVKDALQTSNLLPLGHFYYGGYHDPDTERLQWHNPAINYQFALLREYHEGHVSPPGFMPPLSIVTSLDYEWVYDTKVAPLIDKIREDPLHTGDGFFALHAGQQLHQFFQLRNTNSAE